MKPNRTKGKNPKNTTRKKERMKLKPIIVLLLSLVIQKALSSTKFQIDSESVAQTKPMVCNNPNTWYLYKIALVNSASTPISFPIAHLNPEVQYIQEAGSSQKLYRRLRIVDANCLVHVQTTGKASIVVLVLLIGPSGNGNECKVENIMIPEDMAFCGGSHKPIWDIITFSGGSNDYKSFTTMMYDNSYKLDYYYDEMMRISDFNPATDMDERFRPGILDSFEA